MQKINFSVKQVLINKANTQMMAMTAGAAIIVVFSAVGTRALLIQRAYQNRLITKKENALKELKSNVSAVKSLVNSYDTFQNASTNLLGGNPKGAGNKDGDNARLILDALPSQYDFPALVSSLDVILSDPVYKAGSIAGVDDEINQAKGAATADSKPIEIPFQISASGSYGAAQKLVTTLETSIRPFPVQSIELSGHDSEMQIRISAKTYYLPQKSLKIRTEEVK